jgi:hypothetical protein
MDTWSCGKNKAKTKPIQTQYKPNSNPIYHGVASGEAGTNPATEILVFEFELFIGVLLHANVYCDMLNNPQLVNLV